MIYLIGGPPKCGKTTLAKKLSKKLGVSWVSSDSLEVVAMDYVWKYAPEKFEKLYPHSEMKGDTADETYSLALPQVIAKNYIKQARATYAAIDMFSICLIKDGVDCVIEGYHVTPQLAARLIKKYGSEYFKVVFLVKEDTKKFVDNVTKSSTHNDWILQRTKEKNTLYKIAQMVQYYGKYFTKEAEKYGFRVENMDSNFEGKIDRIVEDINN